MKSLFTLSLLLTSLFATAIASAEETTPPTSTAFTLYQYSGSSKTLNRMDKKLREDPRFKELGCEQTNAGKKSRTPQYLCRQNDGQTRALFMTGVQPGVNLQSTEGVCPTGCYLMRCPPPSGPYACCSIPGYMPCL